MKKSTLLPHASMALLMMLLVAIVSTGCTNSNDNPVNPKLSELTDTEKSELLEKAYVYTLPLMLMDATYIKMTNIVEPQGQQAPANRLIASVWHRYSMHGATASLLL